MKIDWFTFAAQVVNFLILVALLRHFLFRRITAAMEERERKIAERLADAQKRQEEADRAAAEYRRRSEGIERQRAALLAQAKEEAEAQRRSLEETARREIEESRAQWYAAFDSERESVLRELRKKAGEQVLHTARSALAELAGESLEQRVVGVLFEKLRRSGEKAFGEPGAGGKRIVVKSAFAIPLDTQKQMIGELRGRVNVKGGVQFETVPELVCGIELRINGKKISWNIDHYLRDLEEQVIGSLGQLGKRQQAPPARTPPSETSPAGTRAGGKAHARA